MPPSVRGTVLRPRPPPEPGKLWRDRFSDLAPEPQLQRAPYRRRTLASRRSGFPSSKFTRTRHGDTRLANCAEVVSELLGRHDCVSRVLGETLREEAVGDACRRKRQRRFAEGCRVCGQRRGDVKSRNRVIRILIFSYVLDLASFPHAQACRTVNRPGQVVEYARCTFNPGPRPPFGRSNSTDGDPTW